MGCTADPATRARRHSGAATSGPRQSQRRPHRVRPRRLLVLRSRRRRRRRRSSQRRRRTRPTCSARCLRLDVERRSAVCDPAGQSLCVGGDVRPARPHRSPRTIAPRSTRGACAIRGGGASTRRATRDLGLGDVGQGAFEEIDRVQRGGNYGWDCREGTSAFGSPGAELQHGHGSHRSRAPVRPLARFLGHRRLRLPRLGDPGARRQLPVRGLRQRPHLAARAERRRLHGRGAARYVVVDRLVRPGQRRRALRRRYRRRRLAQEIVAAGRRAAAGDRPCRRCCRRRAA